MNMKKIALAAVLAAALPALAADPPGFRFRAALSGTEEVPATASSASGELNMVLWGDAQGINFAHIGPAGAHGHDKGSGQDTRQHKAQDATRGGKPADGPRFSVRDENCVTGRSHG